MPDFDGELLTDEPTLTWAASDWGHLVTGWPLAVLRPANVADVRTMIEFAAKEGLPLTARGAGHSPFGQGNATGGIVVDMTSMRTVHKLTKDSVVVDAGAHWYDVLVETVPAGLTPPVLTDYIQLSVGGTLSVGGLGGASQHYGAQTDTVLSLDLITGKGQRIVGCSPGLESQLFDAVRAGLGQCAVITGATLRLVPAPTHVRLVQVSYDSFASFLADQRTFVRNGRYPYLEGQVIAKEDGGWGYLLEFASYFTSSQMPAENFDDLHHTRGSEKTEDLTYLEFANRLAVGEKLLRASGDWYRPHPWLNLLLPDDHVESLVDGILDTLTQADLGASGLMLLYPIPRQRLRTPLLRAPDADLVWLFSILPSAPRHDPETTAAMITANRAIYQRVRAVGGQVYPTNALPMTTDMWQEHFGPAWQQLLKAKKKYDPKNILGHGQRIWTEQ
jgi:FAD/FMN-containing dehydrogenase